jgi:hypothetical protein
VFQPIHHGLAQFPAVSVPGAGIGGPAQAVVGAAGVFRLPRRHDQAEIGAGKLQFVRHVHGVVHGFPATVEPPAVFLRRGQPGIGRSGITGIEPGKRGVAGDGPQQTVHGKSVRLQKETGRRGHQGDAQAPGRLHQWVERGGGAPGQGRGRVDPGTVPGRQQVGTGSQHQQAAGQRGQGAGQRECRVPVPPGDQPAQVGVAGRVLDQADSAVVLARIGDLGPHDGGEPFLMAGMQEFPQSAEVIRVGEGNPVVAHLPGRSADGCR